MKKYIFLLISFSMLLTACATPEKAVVKYNENSWKTMIADSCTSYFDGCNNCRRSPGADIAACTRKFCHEYKKPFCLDGHN